MNITKYNKMNQNILNNNQPKSLIVISSDLPVKSLYQILLKNPKLVNSIDEKGETLLTYSIKRKKVDVCQLILTSSILDLSYQDKNGNSYLHLAVIKQLEGVVKALIEKGIYINMQNNDGNTPLHFAYLYNYDSIIHILINNHIDINIKNKDNKTAEDLKFNKENNYYIEKEINDKKRTKDKENKSIKNNKEMKLKTQKNANQINNNMPKLVNNITTKTYSGKKKIKSCSGNISYNNSIKRILNKNYGKNNSTIKANKKKILKEYTNSPNKTGVSSEKKERKRINTNRMSPYIKDNTIKKEKSKKLIINNNNKIKNKKFKLNDNYVNKKVTFIDVGSNTSGQGKYKSGTFRDKINKIEEKEIEQFQKLNINNIEDDIFNIAESVDYKQKLAHTSELNTQIVKSPINIPNKKRKVIKKDDYLQINDDIVNIKDNKNNNKIIIKEGNKNKCIRNFSDEDGDEDYENDDNDINDDECYSNFKFEENENDDNEDDEEDNEFDEDEILAQNKSSLNYFENSVLSAEYQQQKQSKTKDFQGRNYSEFSKNEKNDNDIISFINEGNERNNNNKNNLNDHDYFSYKTYSKVPKIQTRKTYSNRFYSQKEEELLSYRLKPYMKDKYHHYRNIINNNNINFENLNFNNLYPHHGENISCINNPPSYQRIPKPLSHDMHSSDSTKLLKNYNPLKEFLSQINMLKYMNNFIQSGFDDINLIIEQAQKGIYIKDSELKEAGINLPGDRAKILIRIQEKAGYFGFAIPKNVYYVCKDLNQMENDENINILNNWLKSLKIEDYLMNFIYNGYYSIELLLLQMESKNPLTVEMLKDEIGIDKIGHRSRIINKLKDEGRSYNNKLKTSVLIVGDGEKNKYCDCLIY